MCVGLLKTLMHYERVYVMSEPIPNYANHVNCVTISKRYF